MTFFTKNKMENSRKDKVGYELWLTEQEEKLILESMDNLPALAITIIRKAFKRGDFNKR